jgi:hypothetical protein
VRTKYLAAAGAAVAVLAAAIVANANPASDSTIALSVNASPKNSGTRAKPKPEVLKLVTDGATKSKTGQPETTDKIIITTPAEWAYRGKRWPKSQRCDNVKADQAKSNSVCPRKSRVGSGAADLLAGNGSIKRKLTVTIHVLKNGAPGFWVVSQPGDVPAVAQFLPGTVRGHRITIEIPPNLEQPLGIKSSIKKLTATFGGTTTVSGRRTGLLESVGCRRGKWTVKEVFDTLSGNLSDSASIRCRP